MNIINNLLVNFFFINSINILMFFIFKTFISEKIKSHIKLEYDIKLENYKTELKSQIDRELTLFHREINEIERINNEKWILKREACLSALEIADAALSNMNWDFENSDKIVKQEVDTIEFRKCYNKLACTCDNPEVLEIFKKATGFKGAIPGDIMTDFRRIVREELSFGEKIVDIDRNKSFFGRIQGDKK